MGFSKAFDKVGHARLIQKLRFYGITGKTNEWIKAFLKNRKQTVVLDAMADSDRVPRVLEPCQIFLDHITPVFLLLSNESQEDPTSNGLLCHNLCRSLNMVL